MRCNICDRQLDDPKFNRDTKQWEPCDTCLSVIADTLAGYLDTPAAEEDAFGEAFSPEDTTTYKKRLDNP